MRQIIMLLDTKATMINSDMHRAHERGGDEKSSDKFRNPNTNEAALFMRLSAAAKS